jgi:hypothetical protein
VPNTRQSNWIQFPPHGCLPFKMNPLSSLSFLPAVIATCSDASSCARGCGFSSAVFGLVISLEGARATLLNTLNMEGILRNTGKNGGYIDKNPIWLSSQI